jgi:hypothetical protein
MTDQEILHLAFHGDTDDWLRLHELCDNRDFEKRLLRVLEKHEGENPAAVASSREYLAEHGLAEP